MNKVKSLYNEKWKPLKKVFKSGIEYQLFHPHWVSNMGRVKRIVKKEKGEQLLNTHMVARYYSVSFKCTDGKMRAQYIHRLVARAFVKQPGPDHTVVIHKNFEKLDNKASNLGWMTHNEHKTYKCTSPIFQAVDRRQFAKCKLTEERVALIKKIINDPNRKTRMKVIAKQFGISEMQLYRIKKGTNWGYVKALE